MSTKLTRFGRVIGRLKPCLDLSKGFWSKARFLAIDYLEVVRVGACGCHDWCFRADFTSPSCNRRDSAASQGVLVNVKWEFERESTSQAGTRDWWLAQDAKATTPNIQQGPRQQQPHQGCLLIQFRSLM